MRILLDENLPADLIEVLRGFGHDVEHVTSKALSGHPDPDVRACAEEESRMLITQDIQFADVRRFVPGTHAGLVLIRLKQEGLRAILAKFRAVFADEDVESWRGCFVVISETKIRVRRP